MAERDLLHNIYLLSKFRTLGQNGSGSIEDSRIERLCFSHAFLEQHRKWNTWTRKKLDANTRQAFQVHNRDILERLIDD